MKNPTQLHKKSLDERPQPRITRLNRAIVPLGIVGVITILGALLFSGKPKGLEDDAAFSTAALISDVGEKPWYENESNQVPGHGETLLIADAAPITAENSVPTAAQLLDEAPLEDNAVQREKLSAAMTSGLVAPSIPLASAPTSTLPAVASPAVGTAAPSLPSLEAAAPPALDQNQQKEKRAFLQQQQTSDSHVLSTGMRAPISPFELKAGSVIPATMISGLNSDLPGQSIAQVRQNVLDSVTGNHVLIPQGAKLILVYDSQVSYGQKRVLAAIKRIIFPNGHSMDLAGMPAVDISGFSGLHDEVDNHYWRIFGSAALMGGISGAFQLSQPKRNGENKHPSASDIMAASLGQQIGQTTMSMTQKNLAIQPTLSIRPGYAFNVMVTSDIPFPHPYPR